MTDHEKIASLQADLLYQKAEYDECSTVRFVAWMAFCAEDPIQTLKDLARNDHASIPELGAKWIRNKAADLLRLLKE